MAEGGERPYEVQGIPSFVGRDDPGAPRSKCKMQN